MRVKLLAALCSVACANAFGAAADDIKGFLEQNKASDAYQVGKKNQDQLGEPLFDFYFGIAALDAGAPGEGVLALERYVLSYPDNRNARFNLARGYYILGEDQRARDEFEALRRDASGEEGVSIERYLDAIRARESRYQPTANLWLETGLGYDNNINSGVNNGHVVNFPGLAGLPQSPNSISVRESDWFYVYAAGAQGTLPIAPGIALYGSGGFDARNYFNTQNDVFEQFNYGANGGLSYLTGKNLFRLGVTAAQQVVDHQNYQLTYGVTGDWSHQFDQFNRFVVGAAFGRHDYDNTEIFGTKDKTGGKINSGAKFLSNDYWGLSAGWTRVFGVAWQPVLSLSVGYTREENTENRPDFTRNVYNARAQVSMTPAARWGAQFGTTYTQADHKADFGGFTAAPRHDRNYGVDAVVSYRVDKAWSVRGEFQWNTQDSNVGLYDYSHTVVAAKMRYEFN